ncbi:MAG: hypothetical protein JO134_05375 [Xanthobacteraceae bacterium]|nr:hypothetical protein [Xanthobacteraceae bacterium]MBV9628232.1 hypothetical protein [Xanthobacteraceae bacterium]
MRSTVSWLLCAMLIALAMPARAQINPSPQWGWSTAGGSGGTPTGPTNPGAYGFGTSTAGGSGGSPTGPLNPNAYGWGTSLGAGSGAIPTGPTVRGLGPIPPDLRIMADPYAGRAAQAYAGPAAAAPIARAHRVNQRPARVVRRARR